MEYHAKNNHEAARSEHCDEKNEHRPRFMHNCRWSSSSVSDGRFTLSPTESNISCVIRFPRSGVICLLDLPTSRLSDVTERRHLSGHPSRCCLAQSPQGVSSYVPYRSCICSCAVREHVPAVPMMHMRTARRSLRGSFESRLPRHPTQPQLSSNEDVNAIRPS